MRQITVASGISKGKLANVNFSIINITQLRAIIRLKCSLTVSLIYPYYTWSGVSAVDFIAGLGDDSLLVRLPLSATR